MAPLPFGSGFFRLYPAFFGQPDIHRPPVGVAGYPADQPGGFQLADYLAGGTRLDAQLFGQFPLGDGT